MEAERAGRIRDHGMKGRFKMSFNDKVYNVLKWIAQYLLPALGTLYFALARLWKLPYAEEVVGTVAAVDTFLGVLLGISSANYSGDGNLLTGAVNEDGVVIELYDDLEKVAEEKDTVMLKVVK